MNSLPARRPLATMADKPTRITPKTTPTAYRARVGISYLVAGAERRVEAGYVAKDLPADAVGWLLDQQLIEEAG